MEEPPWKKIKLSLERPHKDDDGNPIPVLLDITADGQHIYEPKEDAIAQVGENLRRIFLERGVDYFDRKKDAPGKAPEQNASPEDEDKPDDFQGPRPPMTTEELYKMRVELLPHLHIALGEMTQARDLLAMLLSTAGPSSAPSVTQLLTQPTLPTSQPAPAPPPPSNLTATVATKPPPILSVRAFDTQLVIGGKDRALRRAADLFKSAAENMEAGRARSEKHWLDALRIRRGNWGLVPAPLPLGSATGKGADKTSKDFLVSFGLEESPAVFRRRAIGRMPILDTEGNRIEFPLRQNTRLRVSLKRTDDDDSEHVVTNTFSVMEETTLEESLRAAQIEVVEQEVFSALIKEAGNLPTATARVSERSILIKAAPGTELSIQLVDSNSEQDVQSSSAGAATCDLIAAALRVLLLRAHHYLRYERIKRTGSFRMPAQAAILQTPPILQPIIDLLQYEVFCNRVRSEFERIVGALRCAGVPAKIHFEVMAGSGEEFVKLVTDNKPKPAGGEARLRIDNRQTLRFTFVSPSLLIAHLPQATLGIVSMAQLSQLLADEVGMFLLKRICDIGTERCSGVSGAWFVDTLTSRSVGKWEGCVLNFRVSFSDDATLLCTATRVERAKGQLQPTTETYTTKQQNDSTLFDWTMHIIDSALLKQPSPSIPRS
ncbi:subunit 17 of mediator complex-domain-containing protein [Rhodofomes roseus]|uniref:Mediator of RNA polymerase II transcription subunit 17 n=1 Tax=Rhodofomes roseus TaxID=34475 RepID=A0ABQ8L191_9APHY|nr:subunit 17 of mediator complex-domain-containing protein [Rhodofomes roseus]KAH9844297.1 subunit 17 of mediator complex-domain-containing protein [Rhodofomes roseus]